MDEEHQYFENEVIRISRQVFGGAQTDGAVNIEGRERDGVFFNGNFFTVVEATTSRKKEKIETDAKKTADLVKKKRSEGTMAQGYCVTRDEPTADQRQAASKYKNAVNLISFNQLRAMLFDSIDYLACREKQPFGSVFDHFQDTFEIPKSEYITPTITNPEGTSTYSIGQLKEQIKMGGKFLLTAEYGVGKSMLLREVFFQMAQDYRGAKQEKVPVAINLREHNGQEYPQEILERHARNVGVDPQQLVRAWSAGYVGLLIDGFDEISTRAWTGNVRRLREFRRRSHKGIKNLLKSTPRETGILIVGREGYFDSELEMFDSLGASQGSFKRLLLQPFDDDQASQFLKKRGLKTKIPEWLPTRPLLLTYLVSSGILERVMNASEKEDLFAGTAWLRLLDMVCKRESEQSEGVDPDSMRQFLSALGLCSRQVSNSRKSFSPKELEEIFQKTTGAPLLEDDKKLLMRLPGLGVAEGDTANREFIDDDFRNACSALASYEVSVNPHGDDYFHQEHSAIIEPLSPLGVGVLAANWRAQRINDGLIKASIDRLLQREQHQAAFDLAQGAFVTGRSTAPLTFEGIQIDTLDLGDGNFVGRSLDFSECLISRLILPQEIDKEINVTFSECLIGLLEGRTGPLDLESDRFIDCEIDEYESSLETSDAILSSSLPLSTKVLLVTLRKLFVQGGERLESALVRGLDHRGRALAPGIVELMISHGFCTKGGRQGKITYAAVRSMRKRALEILSAPSTSSEALVADCKKLVE